MNLHNRISEDELSKEQFTIKELDDEGKGCITIDSLVKYINARSDYFFINADIRLLLRRVTGGDQK